MSVYEYGDTIIYEATVYGQIENAPPITQPMPDYWPLRDKVYDAARAVVLFGTSADFYLVYRDGSSGNVGRMRWAVQAQLLGPELRWQESSGASQMAFQLKRAMYTQDYSTDPGNPMPWFDFRDLFAAVLGKQALGTGPVQIPVPGEATITFTPEEIKYSRIGYDDARDPYSDPVYGWTFTAEPTDPYEPALWVVPSGQQTGVKVSSCNDFTGQQWSDFNEPAPAFDPLPAPPGA